MQVYLASGKVILKYELLPKFRYDIIWLIISVGITWQLVGAPFSDDI